MNKSNEVYRSRINGVIDYVNNNIHNPLSLEELAGVAYFSPFHFHRVFVAVTGETVNHFTNRIRNEKAARLLKFSPQPVTAIATACGFSSTATLSRQFKQYFGISPTAYRKGGSIKNSKIGKEWYDGSEYHCRMSEAELVTAFPVTIRQFPERRIAYIRVVDAFREGVVLSAFATLLEWARKHTLFDRETIFGMSMDDPDVTPKEKYRYEACITIPQQMIVEPDGIIQTTTLAKCKYAVTTVSGDFNRVVAATNYLFDNWLINSDYECEVQHGLEVFLDRENVCNWSHFDMELCIPVKPLQK
ncbi:MAG: GyrI-like domain-containing protein [Chitinophagaceae bacterium]